MCTVIFHQTYIMDCSLHKGKVTACKLLRLQRARYVQPWAYAAEPQLCTTGRPCFVALQNVLQLVHSVVSRSFGFCTIRLCLQCCHVAPPACPALACAPLPPPINTSVICEQCLSCLVSPLLLGSLPFLSVPGRVSTAACLQMSRQDVEAFMQQKGCPPLPQHIPEWQTPHLAKPPPEEEEQDLDEEAAEAKMQEARLAVGEGLLGDLALVRTKRELSPTARDDLDEPSSKKQKVSLPS